MPRKTVPQIQAGDPFALRLSKGSARRARQMWSVIALALSLVMLMSACAEPAPDRSAPFSLGGNSVVVGFTPTPTPFMPKSEGDGHAENGHDGEATPPPQSPGAGDPVAQGQKLFLSVGCTGCHTIQGLPGATGKVGPELTHVASTAGQRVPGMTAEQYFRRKVTEPGFNTVGGFPPGVMPPGLVKEGPDLDALVAFLLTRQ